MSPSIRRKLEALAERHEEVGRLLAEPDAMADPKRFRDLSRDAEVGGLGDVERIPATEYPQGVGTEVVGGAAERDRHP